MGRNVLSEKTKKQLHEEVLQELSEGKKDAALWEKSIKWSAGSEEDVSNIYIKYRIEDLKKGIAVDHESGEDRERFIQATEEILKKDMASSQYQPRPQKQVDMLQQRDKIRAKTAYPFYRGLVKVATCFAISYSLYLGFVVIFKGFHIAAFSVFISIVVTLIFRGIALILADIADAAFDKNLKE